jgi:DNA-binding transcriptional ArsR family regulator
LGKISRDTPLAEITLRRYEKPTMGDRELVRKFCLSVGLLQPGDSRDVVVDVLHVLLKSKQQREELHSEEVKNKVMSVRKANNLPMLGIASSNIRRQLKRLKDLHLIETNANLYRITEWNSVSEIFEDKVENFILKSVMARVKDYVQKLDEEFSENKEEEM